MENQVSRTVHRAIGGAPAGRCRFTPQPVSGPPPTRGPVRLERWFDRELSAGWLRIGTLREQTSAYRSFNVSYLSPGQRITGDRL